MSGDGLRQRFLQRGGAGLAVSGTGGKGRILAGGTYGGGVKLMGMDHKGNISAQLIGGKMYATFAAGLI